MSRVARQPVSGRETRAWSRPEVREYYETHRRRVADLYPSERFFLPRVARKVATCLDVGCAAGGFFRILRSFNSNLAYTGVDVSPGMVAAARRRFPKADFYWGDGIHFKTPPGSYDLVHASGVLHLTRRHRQIIRACYAQTRRYLLCDFRLTGGKSVMGRLTLAPGAELPYVVRNAAELLGELKSLRPAPLSICARGYPHAPSPNVRVPCRRVVMAFFLIEKGDGSVPTQVDVNFASDPPEATR